MTGHAGWRVAKPLAFAGAGLLLVASAVNSDGTDLRPERYQSLADLAQQQSQRVASLQQEITHPQRRHRRPERRTGERRS